MKKKINTNRFFFNIPGVPSDPGCVLNFLHDVNARQEQIRSEGISPVSIQTENTRKTTF